MATEYRLSYGDCVNNPTGQHSVGFSYLRSARHVAEEIRNHDGTEVRIWSREVTEWTHVDE